AARRDRVAAWPAGRHHGAPALSAGGCDIPLGRGIPLICGVPRGTAIGQRARVSIPVPAPANALVLEDVPDVAEWLARLLAERFPGISVSVAGTLAAAARVLDAGFAPELALVDLALPDGEGTELIARLAQQ